MDLFKQSAGDDEDSGEEAETSKVSREQVRCHAYMECYINRPLKNMGKP